MNLCCGLDQSRLRKRETGVLSDSLHPDPDMTRQNLSSPPTCSRHQHKKNYWVLLLNLLFSCLTIFHLTYLGSMFDPGSDEQEVEEGYAAIHTIQRWSELNWASHWILFACWIFYRLIL
ncbi:hypothetical protein OJAV_G00072130 [Oryzias javanicus]|uniref:Uncharacterized protein n=1 Tax=Oryzias javanicus TaxID=123683 RepID=A0A437D985_ORYJA|nr:hypothetical protein OJAV_G00072130 [Oryzias javanicus]